MALVKHNFGILASITWNSNKWQDVLTKQDIDNSQFDWVKINRKSLDDLNFGHKIYPVESDGNYIGYTPQFTNLPTKENSKYVEIVFFRSHNYHDKKKYIVGYYAFPELILVERLAEHPLFNKPFLGNIRARKENICIFESPVDVSTLRGILPLGKEMGQMGFNYLKYENVMRILDIASSENSGNSNIKQLKYKLLTDKKFNALK